VERSWSPAPLLLLTRMKRIVLPASRDRRPVAAKRSARGLRRDEGPGDAPRPHSHVAVTGTLLPVALASKLGVTSA